MDEVFLVYELQSFHDLDNDLDGLSEGEGFAREFGLVGEEIAHVAVLHDDNNEIIG